MFLLLLCCPYKLFINNHLNRFYNKTTKKLHNDDRQYKKNNINNGIS